VAAGEHGLHRVPDGVHHRIHGWWRRNRCHGENLLWWVAPTIYRRSPYLSTRRLQSKVRDNVLRRDESGTDIIRPTERVRHSNGKTVSESGHLISVTIRTALVFGNSKYNFYYPNMMNITIQHKNTVCIRIRSENSVRERKTICICIRSIRSYPIRFHPYCCKWKENDDCDWSVDCVYSNTSIYTTLMVTA
jgi:hypothetical protein